MGQYLNPGNAGFQSIVNGLYVDKTGLIEYINRTLGTKDKLTCVSRPRRFGKSFATQMLCAYYDRSCDSRNLFQGLQISGSVDFEKHLNNYNVIYLDMTSFIKNRYNQSYDAIDYMQESVLSELQNAFPEVSYKDDLPDMLANIAEATGARFIFIIDEWDVIFREIREDKEQQDKYILLLRRLFKNSGYTDKMIEAAYITGILPIKKYGTQSAMTDFQEYTMLRPGPLKEYVGFTEEETKALFQNSELDFEEARKWYDGYSFGKNLHIYSPKSVIDALRFEEFGNYWTQSETYESLRMYVDMNYDGLKEAIMDLLAGQPYVINPITFQNDMTTIHNKDDILTLFVHLGYLSYDSKSKSVRIPNEEVRIEFLAAVENGEKKDLMNLIIHSEQLLRDTIAMHSESVAEAIENAHRIGTAPVFYNNEQSLGSVIRFAYISCLDDYQLIQELPGGNGYADMVFIPKKHSLKPAMVVELKWNKTAQAAIAQIKDKNYPEVLKGFTSEILLVGINYDEKTKKHTCVIEKYTI